MKEEEKMLSPRIEIVPDSSFDQDTRNDAE